MPLTELLSMSMQSGGHSSYLLLAASMPPLMYLMLKKKKGGLVQLLLLKMAVRRMERKKKRGRFGLKDLFGALSLICLIMFFVFATGGGASGLAIPMAIGFLVFLLAWAFAA